jgi:hypothetical protein
LDWLVFRVPLIEANGGPLAVWLVGESPIKAKAAIHYYFKII